MAMTRARRVELLRRAVLATTYLVQAINAPGDRGVLTKSLRHEVAVRRVLRELITDGTEPTNEEIQRACGND